DESALVRARTGPNLHADGAILGRQAERMYVDGAHRLKSASIGISDRVGSFTMSRLRWVTSGESHGPRLTAIVEGIPSGLPLLASDIDEHLARRQRGYGRGGRMKIETDRVEFTGGVRNGETLGSPIAMAIENRDHKNWLDRMAAAPLPATPEALTRPRPGHADLAGGIKYDRKDLRDILERASARETAARTAAGALAPKPLRSVGIQVLPHPPN